MYCRWIVGCKCIVGGEKKLPDSLLPSTPGVCPVFPLWNHGDANWKSNFTQDSCQFQVGRIFWKDIIKYLGKVPSTRSLPSLLIMKLWMKILLQIATWRWGALPRFFYQVCPVCETTRMQILTKHCQCQLCPVVKHLLICQRKLKLAIIFTRWKYTTLTRNHFQFLRNSSTGRWRKSESE